MVYGYLGMVEGFIERVNNEVKDKCFVIATGGVSHIYKPLTDKIDVKEAERIGLGGVARRMLKGYGPTLTVRSRSGLGDCSSLRCAPGHAWNPQTSGSRRCGESFTGIV